MKQLIIILLIFCGIITLEGKGKPWIPKVTEINILKNGNYKATVDWGTSITGMFNTETNLRWAVGDTLTFISKKEFREWEALIIENESLKAKLKLLSMGENTKTKPWSLDFEGVW